MTRKIDRKQLQLSKSSSAESDTGRAMGRNRFRFSVSKMEADSRKTLVPMRTIRCIECDCSSRRSWGLIKLLQVSCVKGWSGGVEGGRRKKAYNHEVREEEDGKETRCTIPLASKQREVRNAPRGCQPAAGWQTVWRTVCMLAAVGTWPDCA